MNIKNSEKNEQSTEKDVFEQLISDEVSAILAGVVAESTVSKNLLKRVTPSYLSKSVQHLKNNPTLGHHGNNRCEKSPINRRKSC